MEGMYEQASRLYKQLYSQMVKSTKRVKLTTEIAEQLQKVFNNFADNLSLTTQKFNNEILQQQEGENERLLHYYQVFSNSLLKMSQVYRKMSAQIKNQVVDPYFMFVDNYRETNKNINKKATGMLADLQKSKQQLAKYQHDYYNSWIKTQKSKQDIEKAIEKIEKGGKSNDLVKANDASLKLTMQTEEMEREYRQSIDKVNSQWKLVNRQLQNLCTLFQYNEQSRLSFSRNTVTNALRVFIDFGQLNQQQVQAKTKQAEGLIKLSQPKLPLVKSLSGGRFHRFLQLQKKQSFTSYEDSKKKRQHKKDEKPDATKDFFKAINQQDRQVIQSLINSWLAETTSPKQKYQRARQLIQYSQLHSLYFVELLSIKLTKIQSYYCKLQEENFLQLLAIFEKVIKSLQNLVNQRSVEYMYKLMNVSMRVMKKKKDKTGQPRQLLCSMIGKDCAIFTSQKLWTAILQHLHNKALKKKKQEEDRSSMFGKGFALLTRSVSSLVLGKKTQENQEDPFQPTQQIASLMSSLGVPTEFSLPLVKKLLNGQTGPAYEFLRDSLYTKQNIQLRQKLTETKEIRQRLEQKIRKLEQEGILNKYALKIVAKSGFLDARAVVLRQTCKYLQHCDKYILRNIKMPKKWLRILHIKQNDYQKLKQQTSAKALAASIQQIIQLDVHRSLHIHSEYLSQPVLTQILKVFASHHPATSYCQGMNYLAGYLFIRLRSESQAYLIFQKLMQERFGELFANEFSVLKRLMYQFERLLHIFLPEVGDHFKRQLISSQCYIVSWIITLYSATFQHTKKSYMVDFLWDRFVVWGWREFFRFTLFIFSLFKDELVEMTFDKALNFLSELTKTELFTSDYQQLLHNKRFDVRTLEQQVSAFHITNKLLIKLQKEHQMSDESK